MNWIFKISISLVLIIQLVYSAYLPNTIIAGNNLKPNFVLDNFHDPLENCEACILFGYYGLEELLSAIVDAKVTGECSDLCNYVQNKTNSKADGVICKLLCYDAGIEEFIEIIKKADSDTIYYCELLKLCAINDNADANLTSFTVTPTQGPRGTHFITNFNYTSVNGTGTGQLLFHVKTVDGIRMVENEFQVAQPPGTYNLMYGIITELDPACDPTKEKCEQWLAGTYELEMAVCNGACYSKHPHSKVLAYGKRNFTIVN